MFGREQSAQVIDGSDGCRALRKGRSVIEGGTATDVVGGKTAEACIDTRGEPPGESTISTPVLGLAFDDVAVDAGIVPSLDVECSWLLKWGRSPIKGLASSTEVTLPQLAEAPEAGSTAALVRRASA